ncbi:MAG: TolC family protein [Bacteroidetes bacterium]|nr:TolC family protein [Bacteroidota bacterium]
MKQLIILLSLTLTWSLANPLKAQQAQQMSLSLKQAQEYAIQHNLNMKNAQIDIELAKKKIWETKAIGLPQISATGSYQHLFSVPELSFGGLTTISDNRKSQSYSVASTGTPGDSVYLNYFPYDPVKLGVKDNATLDITLSQLIFSGEYIVGLQATKVFLEISQNSLQSAETDMKESVANTYYLVQILDRNKQILSQSLENLTATLGQMKEMNKAGFIEDTDVDQIELTLHTLENGVKTIDNQITAASDLLKFQLGLPFETEVVLTESLDNVIQSSDIMSVVMKQFQVKNHISYKILENQEAAGTLNLKRQKSAYLPNMAAFYKHSEKAKKAGIDFTMKDMVGVSLNIPIFSSGQRNVMVQERQLELEKIKNSKETVAQGLQLDFIKSRNDLNSSYDKFMNEKRNIELTDRIYKKTLVKYKEGVSSSMDLTNAQNQYLTAQSNYFNSLYSLLTAKNKLEKMLNIQ